MADDTLAKRMDDVETMLGHLPAFTQSGSGRTQPRSCRRVIRKLCGAPTTNNAASHTTVKLITVPS